MLIRNALILSGLVMFQVACGDKGDKPEDVNIKDLQWVDKNDVLRPASQISVKGEVFGNRNFVVSFRITDKAGKELTQNTDTINVNSQKPASNKTKLKLHDDMEVMVEAGQKACNGEYILHVNAVGGNASTSKPLNFKVVDGLDATQCQSANLVNDIRSGAIFNVNGKSKGAYDLISGKGVSSKEANDIKDLLDLTASGRSFRMTISSGNGAKFVVDNSLDFKGLTFDDAAKLAAVGTAKPETEVLKAGDKVLVIPTNSRVQNTYYVLNITNVDAKKRSSNAEGNTGVIEFSYRAVSK